MHAGEEDHIQSGWTTSRRGQDSPGKSPRECQRTEINGESRLMLWIEDVDRVCAASSSRAVRSRNHSDLFGQQKRYPKHLTVRVPDEGRDGGSGDAEGE